MHLEQILKYPTPAEERIAASTPTIRTYMCEGALALVSSAEARQQDQHKHTHAHTVYWCTQHCTATPGTYAIIDHGYPTGRRSIATLAWVQPPYSHP